MTQNEANDLAHAVHYWLSYQTLCGRHMLLSESYLAHPIGEYLRTKYADRVIAEQNHPFIEHSHRGRPRQIDYVVTRPRNNDQYLAAVEAKWVNGSAISKQRILDDLLRLECMKGSGIKRYFMLAGPVGQLSKNCLHRSFRSANGEGNVPFIPEILPLGTRSGDEDRRTIPVRDCRPALRSFFQSFADSYGLRLPISYTAELIADVGAPMDVADENTQAVRVMMWEIQSVGRRSEFSPDIEWGDTPGPDEEEADEPVAV